MRSDFKVSNQDYPVLGRAARIDRNSGSNEPGRFIPKVLVTTGVSIAAWAGMLLAGNQDLVENSPFIPEDFEHPDEQEPEEEEPEPEPEPEDDPLDDLELRGITVLRNQPYFSLYDPEQEISFWVGVDQTEEGYTLLDYESSSDSVRVARGERERSIVLNESEVRELSSDEAARSREDRQEQQAGVSDQVEGVEIVRGGDSGDQLESPERPAEPEEDEPSRESDGEEEAATPAEDAQPSEERLREAAEELRRRRALRQGGN